MLKKIFLPVFLLILLIDLFAIYTGNITVQFIVKPMILGSLIFFFLVRSYGKDKMIRSYLLAGLFFSLTGDILLMFDSDPRFFLFGLSAFLIAHICYIILFSSLRNKERLGINAWNFIPVAIYYAALAFTLYPFLGEMRLPVLVYGSVISIMFVLALHMTSMVYREAGKWMAIGAAFFVLSDSLLAFNKFYQSFPFAGILIMLTYAAAQYGIVKGVLSYLAEKENDRI